MGGPIPAPPNAGPHETPPRMMRYRTAIILAVVSLLVGIWIGASGSNTGNPATQTPTVTQSPPAAVSTVALTAEPTAQATAQPTPVALKPIVIRGRGSQNTKPFSLSSGDFTVVITGSGNGNVIVRLIPRGGTIFEGEGLFNEISNGKYRFETVVYGIEPGTYYLDATIDGSWVVTFTPLP
jgi:hypothetical protein